MPQNKGVLEPRKPEELSKIFDLVDNIVNKNYLMSLDVFPVIENVATANDLEITDSARLFHVEKIVYNKDEDTYQKLMNVYTAASATGSNVVMIIDSNGKKTDLYLGNCGASNPATAYSGTETLYNNFRGNFPGSLIEFETDLLDYEGMQNVVGKCLNNNRNFIASISGVSSYRDEDKQEHLNTVQGIEKVLDTMSGLPFSMILIADAVSKEELSDMKAEYELLFSKLTPFSKTEMSYNENSSEGVSNSVTKSFMETVTKGTSRALSTGTSKGTSHSEGENYTHSDSIGGQLGVGGNGEPSASINYSHSYSRGKNFSDSISFTKNMNVTESDQESKGEQSGESNAESQNQSYSKGRSLQISYQNKTIIELLDKLDQTLKRIKENENYGVFAVAAYVLAANPMIVQMAASAYKASISGDKSYISASHINMWSDGDQVEQIKSYLKNLSHPEFDFGNGQKVTPAVLVSSREMALQLGLPRQSVSGITVTEMASFGRNVIFSSIKDSERITLGRLYHMGREEPKGNTVDLHIESLAMHTFITGSTGSGKSNAIYSILEKVSCCKVKNSEEQIRYMVIEPAKGEYKNRFGYRPDVQVYGTNIQKTPILKINPFSFPEDIHVTEHIDRLIEIFNVCWPMYAAMPAILKESVERSYKAAGWDLNNSTTKYQDSEGRNLYPCFMDVLEQINRVIEESKYSSDSKGDYAGALCTRVKSLTNGFYREIFSQAEISNEDLFNQNVIVDLSRIGSMETKALIMGILVMKLQEFRMSEAVTGNSSLRHVTVLEEAHNLLKRTSSEQSADSANLIGKSVEMLSNAIAEMRTYGEGFIIADQAPGLLDMSVIRNTNTKIILRLPDQSDRELVGRSAALNDNQIIELSKLKTGVAAVYQNDWQEAVLCHIDYSDSEEKVYEHTAPERKSDDIIDLVKLLLLPVPLKKKIDVIRLKKLEETIYKANIKAGTKIMLKNYINDSDVESVRLLRQKIMYDIFNVEDIFDLADPDIRNIESWYRYACSEMIPEKDYFNEEELHKIVALLAKENAVREKDELSVKIYDAYMKYI